MVQMNILLIIVFCLVGAAVVLTIANWLYLLSISTKAYELEQEINKKAQEFDNFKKEKQSARQHESIIPIADGPIQDTGEPVLSDEPIQIMRNVGGSFEEAEKHNFKSEKPKSFSTEIKGNFTYPDIQNRETILPTLSPYVQKPTENYPEPDIDVLATVSEQPESNEQQLIVLQLYSESAKDADFGNLWKSVSSIMESNNGSDIGIDFNGINFLYDKELNYLIRIHQVISTSGRKIHFLNCDPELVMVLNKFPHLGHLVQKKDL